MSGAYCPSVFLKICWKKKCWKQKIFKLIEVNAPGSRPFQHQTIVKTNSFQGSPMCYASSYNLLGRKSLPMCYAFFCPGVIWDLTPTDVGWATGARTKARGVVHLLTMVTIIVAPAESTWWCVAFSLSLFSPQWSEFLTLYCTSYDQIFTFIFSLSLSK